MDLGRDSTLTSARRLRSWAPLCLPLCQFLALASVSGCAKLNNPDDVSALDGAPTVESVTSSKTNGAYSSGAVISIEVTFSDTVIVSGTPKLALNSGGIATYANGSGSRVLAFTYTVGSSDSATDLDYSQTTSLTLNSGTIKNSDEVDAVLVLPTPATTGSLASSKALVIDTTAPVMLSVTSSTSNGTKIIGQTVSVTVTFDEDMDVSTSGGTPYITLETGLTDRNASYESGSGTSALVFTYTVQSGDSTADLDYTGTSAFSAGGGAITDLAGNGATLTLPAVAGGSSLSDSKNIVIEGVAPAVTNVTSSTGNATYVGGQAISIQVTFDEAVTVTGVPQLTLETGSSDAVVNYASIAGGVTLTFTYTIASGEASSDLNYQSTSALALNGGTILDASGNAADLTLPGLLAAGSLATNKALVVDALAPTVSYVTSSTANGTYDMGDAIMVQVVFSEAVTVDLSGGGTLQILIDGVVTSLVSYTAGSTTDTLNFLYTVPSGQYSADLNYTSTNALALAVIGGDYVRDGAGNDATLTLPAVAGSDSLAGRKALVVDARVPTVTAVSPKVSVGSAQTITITGTNFRAGATVAFLCDDHATTQTYIYCSGETIGSTSISCPFYADGVVAVCAINAPLDGYDVQVTNVDTTSGSLNDTLIVGTSAAYDTDFSGDGKNTLDAGGTEATYAITVDAAGRTIVAGDNLILPLVARFTAAGVADASFDTDGYKTGSKAGVNYGVTTDSSNNVFAAGYYSLSGTADFLISKYAVADGSESWSTNVDVDNDLLGGGAYAYAVKAKSNGKIVAVGKSDPGAAFSGAIVELNADGTVNTSFDTDGIYTDAASSEFRALAIQSDLKIVAVGSDSGGNIYVTRITTAGALDTTFDSDGVQTIDCGGTDVGYSVAIESGGSIVVAGHVNNGTSTCIAKLTSAGALDTAFDTDGIKTIAALNRDLAPDIAIQGDGKYIVSTASRQSGGAADYEIGLFRMSSTGTLDTTFDTDGKYFLDIGADTADTEVHMALEPSTTGYFGRIHVTSQTTSSTGNIWVGRLFP